MDSTTFRPLDPGMGEAVAKRTVYRPGEHWGDVAARVARGNTLLHPTGEADYPQLREAIAQGRVLLSGRHLQHGDATQPARNQEVFTNCSTSANTFGLFYLLLNGSGVGRSYNDELMLVDWDQSPQLLLVLSAEHPDYEARWATPEDAARLAAQPDAQVITFRVPDSREGWAKAVERLETLTFAGTYADHTLVLDFSDVRPKGAPIAGMQNRPSSGPVPLMEALSDAATVKGRGLARWEQAMRVDHALAACVAVGGARRAARMSVKDYRDAGILDFIRIKSIGGLWSSNNSVGVDAAFWAAAGLEGTREHEIYMAVCEASYHTGSGEPGFINLDQLHVDRTGMEQYLDGEYMGCDRYTLDPDTLALTKALARVAIAMQYPMIVNPCSEIALFVLGAYCVIGTVVPYHCATVAEALDAFALTTRALMRVNLMDSLYAREVRRTNRIGVGFTGIFEFAWKHFRYSFRDLLDPVRSAPFWEFLRHARLIVEETAAVYARELGVTVPHTATTVMPTGTISKLFGLTEGGHLPAYELWLRWVQFQREDPLVALYESKGYPVTREVPNYGKVAIVGFPTEPVIATLKIPAHKFVTAAQATMAEQYRWVSGIETHWLGRDPLTGQVRNNQVSYTLKYDKQATDFPTYTTTMLEWQAQVRCTSVMPSSDWQVTKQLYGYVPEEPISRAAYDDLLAHIKRTEETITMDALQCSSGACPI
jgi:hypothetical protein